MTREKKNYQKQTQQENTGKIQPQAPELETSVIGALVQESNSFHKIEGILTPDDFYNPQNSIIYQAVINLSSKRKPVDLLTVTEELKRMGELENVGGAYYLSVITGNIGSGLHIEEHALIIKQKSMARKIIKMSIEVQSKAYDETEDVADVVEYLEKSFTDLQTSSSGCSSIPLSEAVSEALARASAIQELRSKGESMSISTGLPKLDDIFSGGFKAPDLVILGARPSAGKTQLSIYFAKSAAKNNKSVLFISIEMTAVQLVNRMLLEDDRVSQRNLDRGQMTDVEWQALDEQAGKIWNLKIQIADDSQIKYLANIKSEARRMKRLGKLDMIIIDYLQLIRTNLSFGTRDIEIGYITGELKSLAKELNVPVILLAQLSRPIKGTIPKEPKMDDLRESGNIEQDADKIILIHRPSYYNIDESDKDGVSWQGRGKLIVDKNREGERNVFVLFHHDNAFKRIWGDEYNNPPIPSPSYYEPIRANTDFSEYTPF